MVKLFCVLCAVVLWGGSAWAATSCPTHRTECQRNTTKAICEAAAAWSVYGCRWTVTNKCESKCYQGPQG